MRTRPKCPNCGQDVIGKVCRWCGQPLPGTHYIPRKENEITKNSPPMSQNIPDLLPRDEEIEATVKIEERTTSSAAILNDVRQEANKIMSQAEEAAADIVINSQNQAEAKAARIIAEATEEAKQYPSCRRNAVQPAAE